MSPGTPFPHLDGPADSETWSELMRLALERIEQSSIVFRALMKELERDHVSRMGFPLAMTGIAVVPTGVPKIEWKPDLTGLRKQALLDEAARLYGTSGELDPRGYWARDVESDLRPEDETKA